MDTEKKLLRSKIYIKPEHTGYVLSGSDFGGLETKVFVMDEWDFLKEKEEALKKEKLKFLGELGT